MAKIELIDVSMRDGNQSQWGGTGSIDPPDVRNSGPG